MKKISLIFLFLNIVMTATCQERLPGKAYFHLTGNINNNIPVILDLVKIQDSLYSSFSFNVEKDAQRSYDINFFNPKILCGKIFQNGSFWLKEIFSNSEPEIKGEMTGSGLVKGTWKIGKNHRMFPFMVTEKYPEGSLQFNVYSLKDSKPLLNKAKTPRADISLVLLLPVESSNPIISDSLSSIIVEQFSGRNSDIRDPDKLLEQIKQVYYDNYITSNESLLKEFPDAGNLNWELLKFMNILFNGNHQLTFYILTYAYTGGAHGLETQEFYSIDLTKGRRITLDNIFKEGYQERLSELLTKKVHDMQGIPLSKNLSESGFFVDLIEPNNNFYLTGNGIGFFYNHYEIAPYSNGSTDLFFTFEELKAIIK